MYLAVLKQCQNAAANSTIKNVHMLLILELVDCLLK